MLTPQAVAEFHKALCGNGLTNEVANYLVSLAEEIAVLQDRVQAVEERKP